MGKKITSDIAGGAVFSLPWLVARDEGLFAAENIEIEFVRSSGRDFRFPIQNPQQVDSTQIHGLFELGRAQFFRGCEWGQLRRAYDSKLGGQVIGKRSAVVSQAIIVHPDSPHNRPQDLRNASVAVHFHAGSHYLALQMLEGFLSREEIRLVHMPLSVQRYQALGQGIVDAIAVPEPWISLAEKQNYKVICEAYCVGSEVASPEIDSQTYTAIHRAIRAAVRMINADKKKYLHYLISEIPSEIGFLTPEEFHVSRLRYVDPVPYVLEEFRRAYNWMLHWNLIQPDAAFDRLVDNRIALVL